LLVLILWPLPYARAMRSELREREREPRSREMTRKGGGGKKEGKQRTLLEVTSEVEHLPHAEEEQGGKGEVEEIGDAFVGRF
jgi:hypothetical protein